MWLGELITDRGIGNGMSILIFTQVVATFPGAMWQIKQSKGFGSSVRPPDRPRHRAARHLRRAGPAPDPGAVRQAHGRPPHVRRQLDVHPAQGEPGRCHPGHLRLVAAVPPGADRAVQLPQDGSTWAWVTWSTQLRHGRTPALHGTYFLLIVFFTYFYVSITFNPEEVADNMKKYGGFIPGIRGGRPTRSTSSYVLSRITLPERCTSV
jgi:preprotein translocase subunit SecY